MSTIIPVYGENRTFTLTVNPAVKTARLGENVKIDIGIADIDQSTDGISAIEGMLKFDSDLIESIDISTSSNWSVDINKTQGDPLKGKFVIARLGTVKEPQVIASLHIQIREDATVRSGTVTLKDVFSSYADGGTDKTTKTITINIAEEGGQEDDPIIIPDNPDTPSTPASQDTTTTPEQSTSKSTGTTAKSTTTSKATTLPKAGIIASGIGIAVLAAIIVAIIELVKYKKIEK